MYCKIQKSNTDVMLNVKLLPTTTQRLLNKHICIGHDKSFGLGAKNTATMHALPVISKTAQPQYSTASENATQKVFFFWYSAVPTAVQ